MDFSFTEIIKIMFRWMTTMHYDWEAIDIFCMLGEGLVVLMIIFLLAVLIKKL